MESGYRRIYYDKTTGNEILVEARNGYFIPTTIDQDIANSKILSERNRNTFDVIELPYGAHAQDFAESNGYRVNVETKELEFSPRDPNNPDAPQEFGPPLTKQIEELRTENTNLMLALAEISNEAEINKTNTQLALTEIVEMMVGGMR